MKKIVKSELTRVISYPTATGSKVAIDNIMVLPGVNEFEDAQYNELKKNPDFAAHVSKGDFVLVSEKVPVEMKMLKLN